MRLYLVNPKALFHYAPCTVQQLLQLAQGERSHLLDKKKKKDSDLKTYFNDGLVKKALPIYYFFNRFMKCNLYFHHFQLYYRLKLQHIKQGNALRSQLRQ